MVFNNSVLTNAGASLLAQSQVGESPLTFTRIATGNGVHAVKTVDALKTCTDLTSEQQSFPISSKKYYTDTQVKLTTVITNAELTTGYYMNEIGLFAQLGDDSSTEVLYSIAVATVDNSDFFKPFNGSSPIEIIQSFVVTISNSSTVEVVMGSDAFALATEMQYALDKIDSLSQLALHQTNPTLWTDLVADKTTAQRMTYRNTMPTETDEWLDIISIDGMGIFQGLTTYFYMPYYTTTYDSRRNISLQFVVDDIIYENIKVDGSYQSGKSAVNINWRQYRTAYPSSDTYMYPIWPSGYTSKITFVAGPNGLISLGQSQNSQSTDGSTYEHWLGNGGLGFKDNFKIRVQSGTSSTYDYVDYIRLDNVYVSLA